MTARTSTQTPTTTTTTTREQKAAALRKANADQAKAQSAELAESLNGNPPTTTSPTTGKRRGPARKPLTDPTSAGTEKVASAERKAATAKAPAKKVAKPAAKKPAPAPAAKADSAGVLRKNLAARLIQAAAAEFAQDSDADQQKVANWLKVVTSGIDADGKRIWPTDILPRPTHFSWDA